MNPQNDKLNTRKIRHSEEPIFITRGSTTVPSLSGRVGQRIRKARRELQLTQMQLAEPEFSTSYISSIERGKINPSLTALSILAQKLNLPVTHFLTSELNDQESAETFPGRTWEGQVAITATIALYQRDFSRVFELLTPTKIALLDVEERISAYLTLARTYLAQKDLPNAATFAEQGLHEAQQLEATDLALFAKSALAEISYHQRKLSHALSLYQDCLSSLWVSDTTRHLSSDNSEARLYDPLFAIEVISGAGRCAAAQRNHTLALKYYDQALGFLTLSAKDDLLAAEFWVASDTAQQSQNGAAAARYAQESLALYQVGHLRRQLAILLTSSGKTLQDLEQSEAAQDRLQQAVTYAKQTANREAEALAAAALAELLLKKKTTKEAKKWAEEALVASAELGSFVRGMVAIALAQVAATSGSINEARKQFQRAIALLEEVQAIEELSRCYYLFGEVLTTAGQAAEAANWFKKAYLVHQDTSGQGPSSH